MPRSTPTGTSIADTFANGEDIPDSLPNPGSYGPFPDDMSLSRFNDDPEAAKKWFAENYDQIEYNPSTDGQSDQGSTGDGTANNGQQTVYRDDDGNVYAIQPKNNALSNPEENWFGLSPELNELQSQLSTQVTAFQKYLKDNITPETFKAPYNEFMGKFQSRLQQMFSQQAASQRNQLQAQTQASRDRRSWVIQEKTDEQERQLEQKYVDNMMKAEQWATSGIAEAIQNAYKTRVQGEDAITNALAQNYATTTSFIGNMYAQRQANYRAELQRSTALAQIDAERDIAEEEREWKEDMSEEEFEREWEDFQRKWNLAEDKEDENRKRFEELLKEQGIDIDRSGGGTSGGGTSGGRTDGSGTDGGGTDGGGTDGDYGKGSGQGAMPWIVTGGELEGGPDEGVDHSWDDWLYDQAEEYKGWDPELGSRDFTMIPDWAQEGWDWLTNPDRDVPDTPRDRSEGLGWWPGQGEEGGEDEYEPYAPSI